MMNIKSSNKFLLFIQDEDNNGFNNGFNFELIQFDEKIVCEKYKKRINKKSYMCEGKIIRPIEVFIKGLYFNQKIYLYGTEESKYLSIIGTPISHYENRFSLIEFKYLEFNR